jgi:hypothetical protein
VKPAITERVLERVHDPVLPWTLVAKIAGLLILTAAIVYMLMHGGPR